MFKKKNIFFFTFIYSFLSISITLIFHVSCTQETKTNKAQNAAKETSIKLLPNMNALVIKDTKIPIVSSFSGWVDRIHKTENSLLISGWAGDIQKHIVASFVLVFVDSIFVAKAQLNQERPDVARTLGKELRKSGYRVDIPLNELSLNTDSIVSVIAVFPEDVASELSYAHYLPFRPFTQELKNKPNILLISLDALRADHLSCYGHSRLTSPFLDELASKGIRFENTFINTLGTIPSHVSMLSSLYQKTHRICHDNPGCEKFTQLNEKIPDKVIMLQEVMNLNGYITLGVTGGGYLTSKFGFSRGFDEYETVDNTYLDIAIGTSRLIKMIQRHNEKARPIFAFYHTYEIHSPYEPLPQYRSIFGEFESDFDLSSSNLLKYVNRTSKLDDSDLIFLKAMYDAEIRFTDDTLKYLFDKLREMNFFKRDYLVIITADHGEEFGDHGSLLHQGFLYDELLHVPLIILGGSIPKGKVDRRMVSLIDIAPTILNYACIKTDVPLEGKDLFAQEKKRKAEEEIVFSQYGNRRYSIRQVEWKLIETTWPQNQIELYHISVDPKEKDNVANKYTKVCDDLMKKLSEWKSTQLNLKKRSLPIINTDDRSSKKQLEKLKSLGYIK